MSSNKEIAVDCIMTVPVKDAHDLLVRTETEDAIVEALDKKDSEISRLTAELERVKGELDSVHFKAHAWDNLWESCKEWAEATEAHDHRSGTERTVESLLDFAKQNKRLRSDLAAARGELERLRASPVPNPPRRDPEDFIEHRNGPEVKQ